MHECTLITLFTIYNQVIRRFTFGKHLLGTYEVRIMLEGTIMLFKVLCALSVKENIHKMVVQLVSYEWGQA